jgi:IPT/TIG domain
MTDKADKPEEFGSAPLDSRVVQPTPTQAENDQGVTSGLVLHKTTDGSPADPGVMIPPGQTRMVLTSISPLSAAVPSATITANGTGFLASSKIVFDNVAKTTTFVDGTKMTAAISGGVAGKHSVRVHDPVSGANSETFSFTFTP